MSTDNASFETTNGGKNDTFVRGNVDSENSENIDNCLNKIGAKCLEMNHDKVQNGSKDLLGVPRTGHRKSFMEEESAKEKARVSLLRQCSALLKLNEQKYNKDALHRTFQDEGFLDKIFRLFDVEGKDYLIQEDWIEFLKERLTEEKQLDFVEQVESVAYVLCGEGVVTPDSFQLILKNKVVTKKLLVAVDSDGDGAVTADEIMDFLSAVSTSRPRAGIDQSSVDRLEQLFRETVGDQREITSEHFQKIFVSKNSFFTKRVFQIFDEDNSGAISLQEFIAAVHRFGRQTPEDKIRFLFKVYDVDGDGLIQQNELQEVMRACMHENGMHFSEEQLCDLTEAMFCDADLEGRGAITYEALRDQLSKHGGLLENLSISIDRWLVPPSPKPSSTLLTRLSSLKPYQMSFPYFKNNHVFVMYLLMFFVLNLALFVARIVEYWHSNVFVIFARACGQCLNFTCSWVLVLMLRCCITALRTRGIGSLLPLDHHIYLHKLTGVLILVYSVIHTIMHLCNFSVIVVNDPVLNANNYTLWEWIGSTKPGLFGLVGGCANPTGLALCFTLFILATCSRPAVRRGGCFEIFYFTHLLYIPFWVLLLFHAPNFWKWFIAPGTIYILERVLRLTWMRSERGKSYIASGILLPSRVTHLVVKRPSLFHFHAGDYVFVNIPDIASYEWHPFTISSAPDQEDYIWLHIRGVGQWTNRLYEYFEMEQQRLHANTHQAVNRTHSGESCKSAMSRRKGSGGSKPRSVDFSPLAFDNTAFCADESNTFKALSPLQNARPKFLSPLKLLEKSHSMPDVFNNMKRKPKPNFPPESLRCGSELYIAEVPRRRITGGTRDAAVAHSFRYMRTKPTIISCRPPDERRRSNESILSLARRRFSKSRSPERDVEKEAPVIQEESPDSGCEDYPSGKPLEIYLDGPYGAASSHIFRAQHAVLIAAGIGVTPFASILQAIMYKYRHARVTCPNCSHTWPCRPRTDMTLRKVDFFWINREQRSFEWFVSLLSQLEIEQAEAGDAERFLEMHMYITSALQRSDMKAVGLQLALDLLHEKEKRDLITGLKTRTNAGRPNWDKVFQRLQEQGKGKVTVFYCGPPLLARALRIKCDQFGFDFRKEVF